MKLYGLLFLLLSSLTQASEFSSVNCNPSLDYEAHIVDEARVEKLVYLANKNLYIIEEIKAKMDEIKNYNAYITDSSNGIIDVIISSKEESEYFDIYRLDLKESYNKFQAHKGSLGTQLSFVDLTRRTLTASTGGYIKLVPVFNQFSCSTY